MAISKILIILTIATATENILGHFLGFGGGSSGKEKSGESGEFVGHGGYGHGGNDYRGHPWQYGSGEYRKRHTPSTKKAPSTTASSSSSKPSSSSSPAPGSSSSPAPGSSSSPAPGSSSSPASVCSCPANTSGVLYGAADSSIVQLNQPAGSATCGGCPNGLKEECYPAQSNANPASAIADVDIQCPNQNYSNFCACPSDGSACYQVSSNQGPINDIQIFSFCDAGECNSYLIFFGQAQTDALSNGNNTVTNGQQFNANSNLVNMGSTSAYIKAPAFSVSCNGCNGISSNNAQSGSAVSCSGPLAQSG